MHACKQGRSRTMTGVVADVSSRTILRECVCVIRALRVRIGAHKYTRIHVHVHIHIHIHIHIHKYR
jgi:hypothetical protein